MLRYLTAGESHGECLISVLDGMPSGLKVKNSDIDSELSRRQRGFGRGARMNIEHDKAKILAGLRHGITLGSPIAVMVKNKDFSIDRLPAVTCPRPGHADLAGSLKYGFNDARNVLERASARETAARVSLGAICKIFLEEFRISVMSHVAMLGGISADTKGMPFQKIKSLALKSIINCPDKKAEKLMVEKIIQARDSGNTLGGAFEIVATGLPCGLGSYAQHDIRLDGRLAGALMSIPAIKAVEIGKGIKVSASSGAQAHDPISYKSGRFKRISNNAGGLEGGMTNGEPLILRAYMKPIATLMKPLSSVDMNTKKPHSAAAERSDVCALPAAGVVGEAAVAFEIARSMLDKFGGDSIKETKRNYEGYLKQLRQF